MKPVRLTPRADSDIDACFFWIAKDNPAAALRFLDAIELTCDALSRMPGIGSPRYAEIPLVHGVRMLAIKDFARGTRHTGSPAILKAAAAVYEPCRFYARKGMLHRFNFANFSGASSPSCDVWRTSDPGSRIKGKRERGMEG
jgi:plasmid stabilization system protein ParE